jgi:hypothetical protein
MMPWPPFHQHKRCARYGIDRMPSELRSWLWNCVASRSLALLGSTECLSWATPGYETSERFVEKTFVIVSNAAEIENVVGGKARLAEADTSDHPLGRYKFLIDHWIA